MALSVCHGSLGLSNPSLSSDNISICVSAPFIDLIVVWSKSTVREAWYQQQEIKLLIYISNYQQLYNVLWMLSARRELQSV